MPEGYSATKAAVEATLTEFFDEKIALAEPIGPSYVRLWQTMQQLSQAGGKRLRPLMLILSYHTFGGNPKTDILPVATAWELLHLCMLIHDDIIDNDLVRYGVPNVAGAYLEYYRSMEPHTERRQHLARSAAILAGDLAHSSAHELIIKSTLSPEQKILATEYMTAATFVVAGGELMDTESVLHGIDAVDPLSIARYKTASYSFVGPLCAGAALAGVSERQLELLEQFGTALGCGFQLVDDMLGLFGDEATTGKATMSDIREGKRTYLMQYAFQHASAGDQQILKISVGKTDISDQEAAEVRAIVIRSGAKKAAEAKIAEYESNCRDVLAKLSRDGIDVSGLEQLMERAIRRTK